MCPQIKQQKVDKVSWFLCAGTVIMARSGDGGGVEERRNLNLFILKMSKYYTLNL